MPAPIFDRLPQIFDRETLAERPAAPNYVPGAPHLGCTGSCPRCAGLAVVELVYSHQGLMAEKTVQARCLQCGWADFMEHRHAFHAREQERQYRRETAKDPYAH